MGGLSEHRWRGEGTLSYGVYIYVYSGLPENAPKAMQGVAICMNSIMQRAWRAAGNSVRAKAVLCCMSNC